MNEQDNIEQAMDKVVETLELSVSNRIEEDGEPNQKQVLIRVSESQHARWKQAADKSGISMAQYIRAVCDEASEKTLNCPHPMSHRKKYPWANICTICKTRLPQEV